MKEWELIGQVIGKSIIFQENTISLETSKIIHKIQTLYCAYFSSEVSKSWTRRVQEQTYESESGKIIRWTNLR